jgi:uncharacterized membrane protein YebE (DUF533 family)
MRDHRNIDASRILGQLLSSGAATGIAGALAGGMLTSKRGRKLGKKAVEIGGLAAVAGLAWMAWDRYRGGGASSVSAGEETAAAVDAATRAGFLPARTDLPRSQELGLTLIRAMIAAARADGKLEGHEGDAIFRAVDDLALDADEKALLLEELSRSVDVDELVAAARTPEMAAEIYAAALLAIEVDTPAERAWLAMLAARLGLPEPLVAHLEARADSEPAPRDGMRIPARSKPSIMRS